MPLILVDVSVVLFLWEFISRVMLEYKNTAATKSVAVASRLEDVDECDKPSARHVRGN